MAKRFRLREIEKERGELTKVIPSLVNKHGQAETGRILGVSPSSISLWLKKNGYVSKIIYTRQKEQAS